MRDLAKIGLPLQIGFPVHVAGDVLFLMEMKRRGCL